MRRLAGAVTAAAIAAGGLSAAPGADARRPVPPGKVRVCKWAERGDRRVRLCWHRLVRPARPQPAAPAAAAPGPGPGEAVVVPPAAPVVNAVAPVAPVAPVDATPTQPGADPAPVAPVATDPSACADRSPWIGVRLTDDGGVFRLAVRRDCVPAGRVLVAAENLDAQVHDVHVAPVGGGASRRVLDGVEPHGRAQGAVDLPVGEWRLFCAIRGHESMQDVVSVTR
jgi:hypothetical protein